MVKNNQNQPRTDIDDGITRFKKIIKRVIIADC